MLMEGLKSKLAVHRAHEVAAGPPMGPSPLVAPSRPASAPPVPRAAFGVPPLAAPRRPSLLNMPLRRTRPLHPLVRKDPAALLRPVHPEIRPGMPPARPAFQASRLANQRPVMRAPTRLKLLIPRQPPSPRPLADVMEPPRKKVVLRGRSAVAAASPAVAANMMDLSVDSASEDDAPAPRRVLKKRRLKGRKRLWSKKEPSREPSLPALPRRLPIAPRASGGATSSSSAGPVDDGQLRSSPFSARARRDESAGNCGAASSGACGESSEGHRRRGVQRSRATGRLPSPEEEEEEEEPAEEEETKAPSPKEAVLGAAQAKQVADPALARLAASTDAGDVISAVRAAWKAADAAEKEATARRRPNRTELTRVIDCMWDLMGTENEAEECVVKLLIRAIDLLYRCGFPVEDVCSVLAHASIYFVDVLEFCGPRMESREAGNILVVLMYLAHSYVMDEACPLKTWHSNLFRGYCSVGTLNAAAMKLLEVRGWVLRVEPDELARRYELLMQVSEKETAAR